MDPNVMKNMVILRNLQSNMVEEAYIVFKNNVKIHKLEKIDKRKKDIKCDRVKTKDYMIKEAEMIVSEYITKIEKRDYELGNGNKKLKQKYDKLKMITIFLGVFSLISIILAIFK